MVERAKHRPDACRLFSRGVIFTSARVSLALLSLRKNGGLLVVYDLRPLWEKTNFPENLVTVFRHKIWHIRHGLTAIYQSEISFDGLTHQALAYIEGSQLVIFFPLTGFDRCGVVVFYKDLPLTDKKRRLFEKNAKQLPLKSTLSERK